MIVKKNVPGVGGDGDRRAPRRTVITLMRQNRALAVMFFCCVPDLASDKTVEICVGGVFHFFCFSFFLVQLENLVVSLLGKNAKKEFRPRENLHLKIFFFSFGI